MNTLQLELKPDY